MYTKYALFGLCVFYPLQSFAQELNVTTDVDCFDVGSVSFNTDRDLKTDRYKFKGEGSPKLDQLSHPDFYSSLEKAQKAAKPDIQLLFLGRKKATLVGNTDTIEFNLIHADKINPFLVYLEPTGSGNVNLWKYFPGSESNLWKNYTAATKQASVKGKSKVPDLLVIQKGYRMLELSVSVYNNIYACIDKRK